MAMAQAQGISDVKCTERLGKSSQTRRDGYLIWFHARNIQHARPFLDVIEELVEIYPDLQFLITTRKHEHIADFESQLPDYICHQFLPLELMKPIGEFLTYWAPDMAVFSGGELLPRMMREIGKEDIPLVSVNTQITERMFHRLKWLPGLASTMVKSFDMILVENKIQLKRLKRMGAVDSKLKLAGAISRTKTVLENNESVYAGLSNAIGSRLVWMSAYTARDEEDAVVNAHKTALRRTRRLLLILQTQEPGRGKAISQRYENQNLTFALAENGELPDENTDVFVSGDADALSVYLRLASVTFCGGTLSTGATIDPFHPASLGSAIVYGPVLSDYEEDFYRYAQAGAAQLVVNGGQLAKTIVQTIVPDVAAEMAHNAWDISSEGGVATGLLIAEIQKTLGFEELSYETA